MIELFFFFVFLLVLTVMSINLIFKYLSRRRDEKKLKALLKEIKEVLQICIIAGTVSFLMQTIGGVYCAIFGKSFYAFFMYVDEEDGEAISTFWAYRYVFFITIGLFIIHLALGGSMDIFKKPADGEKYPNSPK